MKGQEMSRLEHRIVAHHVGGRGFGVALQCPTGISKDIVNVLYEADEKCAREMIEQNTNENFHVLPFCLGGEDGPGKLYVTNNPYANSNLRPSPEYDTYYCEVTLSGEIDGVSVEGTRYDALYGNENKVVEVRNVMIHALDTLMREGKVPDNLYPDFLSLDTQGSELSILKGAERTFHDHCVALATEIEFHPMYQGQALFSEIFQFALGHGFHFVGFTYLQEISSNRLPVGVRAKGFLAFGDALFFRRIDRVKSIATSENERYLKLLKLAFIALNFGHLEYALEVLEAADLATPDSDLRQQLMRRDCFRILYDLQQAARELPPALLHFDRSELVAELKKSQYRAQIRQGGAPLQSHVADHMVMNNPAQSQRIRYLLFTNPPAAISKLYRHFFRSGHDAVAGPCTAPASITPVESVLANYGYIWLADVVRQRRKSTERSVPGQM